MNSRRDFFKKIIPNKEEKIEIFPPYFKEKDDFSKCIDCEGDCAKYCEENIIKIVDKKPLLDFSKRGCTYCDECANHCPFGVLKVEYKKKIDLDFSIDIIKCLAWNKTMCNFCADVCFDRAIEFLGLFRPSIKADICTSCGFCVGVCPTNAINIKKGFR